MHFNEEQESFIRDRLPELQEVGERNIHFYEEDGTITKISIKEYLESIVPSLIQVNPDLVRLFYSDKKKFQFQFKNLLQKIKKELRVSELESRGDLTKEIKDELHNLIPCADSSNMEKIILVHKETLIRYPYDYRNFLYLLGWEMSDVYQRAIIAKHVYNPRKEERIFQATHEGVEIKFLNTYRQPLWKDRDISDPKIPELFTKFMKHLFPIKDERLYVYDWLHKSLTDRAYVYLVLNGKKGVGKNTFKHFYRALHGPHNFVDGKKSLLTTQFNSQLDECRALVLDEVKYGEDEENVLKEIQNDNVSIEKKGEDATRGSVIHCSIILMNNEAKDNYIAVDSRRFAPMTLGEVKLEEAMTTQDIDLLIGKFKEGHEFYDPEFISQIGHWILKKGRDTRWGKEDCYKGPKFYDLVQTSLSEWRKYIISEVRALKNSDNDIPLLLSNIAESFGKKYKNRKTFPDYTRVVNFCHYYRDKEGKRLLDIREIPEEGDYEVFPFVEASDDDLA